MRRALLLLTIALVGACAPAVAQVAPASFAPASTSTSSTTTTTTAPAPPPDPCHDFHALHAGRGAPERQHWFNHLRTDGAEPDYVRYYVACQPEGDGGRFWHPDYGTTRDDRRWSTAEYHCIRGLLDGEHGGQAWDTWHRHQPGVNLPQAMPYSKIAGLTVRETVAWMVDYVNGRYGGPFRTPRPCRAGY